MKPFYTSEERAHLAAQADAPSRLCLAWAMRQLEPERSAQLFETLRAMGDFPEAEAWRLLAQAEALALAESGDAALEAAEAARHAFARQEDALGVALCERIAVDVAWARGEETLVETLLARHADRLDALGATLYADAARIELASRVSVRDLARSQALIDAVHLPFDPLAQAMHTSALGVLAVFNDNILEAAQAYLRAFDLYQDLGMRYRMVVVSALLAHCYSRLGDPASAIEWSQQGLTLAEPAWKLRASACRFELGHALMRQQQPQAARDILESLLLDLVDRPAARVRMMVLQKLAELAISDAQWDQARSHYEAIVESAKGRFVDTQASALGGLALVSLGEGQIASARTLVAQGLQLARQQGYAQELRQLQLALVQIELAEGRPDAALTRLQRLQADRAGSDDQAETLRLLAKAHEALGQWPQALQREREASEAEQAVLRISCEHRLKLLHLEQERHAERQQHEAMRRQNAEAMQRAAIAEKSLATLEQLAHVGRGLTAMLQPQELFSLLERELSRLMPVDTLLLFERRGEQLVLMFGTSGARLLQLDPIAMDDPHALSARCAREARLLRFDGEQQASRIAAASATHSLLFAPLQWNGRVVGVLSLQAQAAQAYGEREQQLLLSLAAYLAIALTNARTHAEVASLQHRLAERRRQAALGSLVAGVAHELNTPLGNSLLAQSVVAAKIDELRAQLTGGVPRRSALLDCIASLDASAELLAQGLQRAISLVTRFKELADDRSTEAPLMLDPTEVCLQVLAGQRSALQAAGVTLHWQGQACPALPLRRHALVDVLNCLLDNVRLHAGAQHLRVEGRVEGPHYRFDWIDDGCGIAVDPPERVFDPFYSTRFGQGGSGLGLSLALQRARTQLGGDLQLLPSPQGAHFVLLLPMS